ncbi:MAG TPA: 2-C-methyl-D-erythritol 2,4-cyclodiphosphate synthase [Chitinivibrionales bacterium]|nr:2-C-methyl-D-erythritol 2,4-cyclodiphosphate synthase [Chitinivibrionales bacterium]
MAARRYRGIKMTGAAPGFKAALGQDSHRFEGARSLKPLMLGGIAVPGCPGLAGNSDADVVLHAVTNAVSGISGKNILGRVADRMCLDKGITDSAAYLKKALATLGPWRLVHVSVCIEGKRPVLAKHIPAMKKSIARICSLTERDIGITATTGEGLTAFGRGKGMQAFAVVTAERRH